jgi:hypothetical protein
VIVTGSGMCPKKLWIAMAGLREVSCASRLYNTLIDSKYQKSACAPGLDLGSPLQTKPLTPQMLQPTHPNPSSCRYFFRIYDNTTVASVAETTAPPAWKQCGCPRGMTCPGPAPPNGDCGWLGVYGYVCGTTAKSACVKESPLPAPAS